MEDDFEQHCGRLPSSSSGFKTILDRDGNSYSGVFVNKKIRGQGLIKMADGTKYLGEVFDNEPHGEGKFWWPNDTFYSGHVDHGVPHGKGKLKLPNGLVYEGFMEDGQATGLGTVTYPDETSYRGEVHELKPDGYGRAIYLDGVSYIGFFEAGKKSGYGNLYSFDSLVYSGHWRNDLKHGVGVLISNEGQEGLEEFGIWSNGTFTTEFPEDAVQAKRDEMDLFIKKTLRRAERTLRKIKLLMTDNPNSEAEQRPPPLLQVQTGLASMLGMPQRTAKKLLLNTLLANATDLSELLPSFFKHSLTQHRDKLGPFDYSNYDFHSSQVLAFQDWRKIKENEWYKGEMNHEMKPCGKGILAMPERIFEGFWFDGLKTGLGREIDATGAVHDGYWVQGMKTGYGVYKKSKEDIYAGDWRNDKPHGDGIQLMTDYRYEGAFINGKKDGKGRETYVDFSTYYGDFENDLRHGYGVLIEPSGRKYAGAWSSGTVTGRGVEVEANGISYCGGFKDSRRFGGGIVFDGKCIRRATYKDF